MPVDQVAIPRYDVAVDGYLHTLVRGRPWIKKQEEALLLAFGEWLYRQGMLALTAATPDAVARYAADEGLSIAAREQLELALHHLFTWAIYDGAPVDNPFAPPA